MTDSEFPFAHKVGDIQQLTSLNPGLLGHKTRIRVAVVKVARI